MSANSKRDIKRSVLDRVRALLQAPPTGSGLSQPFTVYNVAQMRQVRAKTLTPSRPCAFVVASRQRPLAVALPLVIVSTTVRFQTMELGRDTGGRATIEIGVVGRENGEADDLADLFANNMRRTLALYDYSTGSPVLVEQAAVRSCEIFENPITAEAQDEGTYDFWDVVGLTADFLQ